MEEDKGVPFSVFLVKNGPATIRKNWHLHSLPSRFEFLGWIVSPAYRTTKAKQPLSSQRTVAFVLAKTYLSRQLPAKYIRHR